MNEQSQSNKQALVLRYDLELVSPPCHPGAATWSALASLDTEIDAVLPYLNARLERAEPRWDRRPRANLMQLYRLLPRSNCAKCGCATCLAFSAGLLAGNKQL